MVEKKKKQFNRLENIDGESEKWENLSFVESASNEFPPAR
jgi:hypothetical protein